MKEETEKNRKAKQEIIRFEYIQQQVRQQIEEEHMNKQAIFASLDKSLRHKAAATQRRVERVRRQQEIAE